MRGTTDHELMLLSCFGVALAKSGKLGWKETKHSGFTFAASPLEQIQTGAKAGLHPGHVAGLSQGHMDIKLAVALTEFQSH